MIGDIVLAGGVIAVISFLILLVIGLLSSLVDLYGGVWKMIVRVLITFFWIAAGYGIGVTGL